MAFIGTISKPTRAKPVVSRGASPSTAWRAELLNIAFFAAMLLVATMPLIVFRHSAWLDLLVPTAIVAEGLLGLAWWKNGRTGTQNMACRPRSQGMFSLVLVLLLLVTWFGFYLPQSKHFWGGYDDSIAYQSDVLEVWASKFDAGQNRPAIGWSYLLGHLLGGGRIEGFIRLNALLSFVGALLVWQIMQTVRPGAYSLALGAAALFVVNRTDPLKFYPTWAANPYGLSVILLLFASWMFVLSWQRQNRAMLIAACLSLMASLAMYEAGYPLTLLPLLYVFVHRQADAQWRFWMAAWTATVALMASRFAVFLLTTESTYQLKQAKSAGGDINQLFSNLWGHVAAIATFFDFNREASTYWLSGCFVAVATGVAIWLLARRDQSPKLAHWAWIIGVSASAVLLAVAPYAHVQGNSRTQFFAAPAMSMLMAALVGAGVALLPSRWARVVYCSVIGILCGNATAQSLYHQSGEKEVTYEKTLHVLEQVHAICPTLTQDTLVILTYQDRSPLGADYCAYHLANNCGIGCHVLAVGDGAGQRHLPITFSEKEIEVGGRRKFARENLVVFRLEIDGTLHFCSEWPSDTLGAQGASRYAPLARLHPGPITPLRYLNYPSWKERPLDVVQQNTGVVFGRGWSRRKFADGWIYRDVEQDCELLVNSQGNKHVELDWDIAPFVKEGDSATLEILNDQDEIVASAALHQRQRVHLQLPCDSEQVEVFRMRVRSSGVRSPGRLAVARVYCAQGPLEANPLPKLADITHGDIELGDGWYTCERHCGVTLRWLNTDGIVFAGPCDPGQAPTLVMEVTPGPGMGGRPCTIELVDENGSTLASKSVTARERIAMKLPVDFPERTRLTVRVLGGGEVHAPDTRVLNLMVTRCEWQATAAQ